MKNKPWHKITIHHWLPKFAWGSNNDINRIKMREVQHRAHHTLFWPANITEQIEIVLHRNIQILQEDFVEKVLETLEHNNPDYIYKDWVYIPRKYKKHTNW